MSDDFTSQPEADELVIGGPGAPRSRKRWWIGGGVLGLLAVGGGAAAWAAASFFSQGSQPAEALPDSTIGYVSVDLDPSGGQKIAALKLARQFPAFKDKVGLQTDDDIRKWIFGQIADESGCKLDFDKDVAPWLGSRAAVAAVGADKPIPVVVVQANDTGKAKAGIAKLSTCGGDGSDEVGWTFDGDWIVFAETAEQAKQVVKETEKGSLADDPDFRSWTKKAGDSGILTAYAAPAAGQAIAKQLDGIAGGLGGASGSADSDGASPSADGLCGPEMLSEGFTRQDCEKAFGGLSDQGVGVSPFDPLGMLGSCPGLVSPNGSTERLRAQLADFGGAAATLRFGDRGVELEMVGDVRAFGGLPGKPSSTPVVSTLPADTAAAVGFTFPKGWTDRLAENLENVCGDKADPKSLFAPLSRATGLDLPGDLEKLLGDSAAIALGPGIDVEGLVNGGDPSSLPLALKVRGDKDTIDGVVTKLRQSLGAPDGVLDPVAGDGAVALGLDKAYAAEVAKFGELGSSDAFTSVVPNGDSSNSVFYVNVDALDRAVKALAGGDEEVVANLAPLRAFGISGWSEGKDSHALVKLSVD